MHILNPRIEAYLERLAGTRDPVLREMEAIARRRGFPIIGPQVGALLCQLALISGARRILELGSGYGYSASWFARGLARGGRITCVDGDRENAQAARYFFQRQRIAGRIRYIVGDGLEVARRLRGTFDIVLNDVDKEDYPRVLPVVLPRLRRGGILVTDNMLWNGRVVRGDRSESARGVRGLTRLLYTSDRFLTTLLPIRDGVTISVKLR
jgi:predicted O-methyltransferase YrrM